MTEQDRSLKRFNQIVLYKIMFLIKFTHESVQLTNLIMLVVKNV